MEESHYTGMIRRLSRPLWEKLSAMQCGVRSLRPRETMTRAHEPLSHSALLLDGWLARDVRNATGDRQLVSIQVPGDFVDLHSLPLGRLDHDVVALSAARVALFEHADIKRLMAEDEEYARQLWTLTIIDASISRHWTFRMGRMRAMARLTNFLCEMHLRLSLCGRGREGTFDLPCTQEELGQICGLSKVHVSRVLKDIREADIATIKDGTARLHDVPRAERKGVFDPGYLFLPWWGSQTGDARPATLPDAPRR